MVSEGCDDCGEQGGDGHVSEEVSAAVVGQFEWEGCAVGMVCEGCEPSEVDALGDGTAELLWRVVHAVEVEAVAKVVWKAWQCGLDEVVETM